MIESKLKLMALPCSFFTRATLKNNENKLDDGTLSCQINKFMKICCTGWCVGGIWACYFAGVIYCSHDNYVTLKALSDTRLLQILITPAKPHISAELWVFSLYFVQSYWVHPEFTFSLGARRKFQKEFKLLRAELSQGVPNEKLIFAVGAAATFLICSQENARQAEFHSVRVVVVNLKT